MKDVSSKQQKISKIMQFVQCTMWTRSLCSIIFVTCLPAVCSQFFNCHNDPSYDPDEGPIDELQFTWLGVLQYVHVKNGTPHFYRVPRVVLISRQFVLSTAVDAAQLPDGYALGNVVFGDYERDEEECQVTIEELAAGVQCEPAVLLMPIADVLLHPEYKHFGARNSIALMKLIVPVKSGYVIPACVPLKNFVTKRNGKQTNTKFYHIDFSSEVPRDFIDEEKEVTKLSLLPREICYLYDQVENRTTFAKNRIGCTSGCGLRSGTPSLYHEHTGHWTLVAIATGGAPCGDPLRPRRPPPPPRHLLLHPYVPWITAAISGRAIGAYAKDDPFGIMISRTQDTASDLIADHWTGHWFNGGFRCYERGDAASDMFRFYHEIFQIKPKTGTDTFVSYYLEIDTVPGSMIVCVRVGMPYRMGRPRVWELDSPTAKVRIPVIHFQHLYKFQVQAWAVNTTEGAPSSSSSTEEDCDSGASDCD